MRCGSVDVHSMLYPLITLVQWCKPSFIFCFPLYSSHAKKAVQDYETQDKARESFGEEGSEIIHGCLTRSKQPWAISFFIVMFICQYNTRKIFTLELWQANLESLPPHVPTYLRAAVGPPSTSSRRHYCSVCGSSANYTCVRCGTRFCSCRCQGIHNDTRCLKFVVWSTGSTSYIWCMSPP
jgi:hypothetical protein